MNLEIALKKGIGDIRFGMSVEAVEALLGSADEEEVIEGVDDEEVVKLCWSDPDLSLFFKGTPAVLTDIDVADEDCTLLGRQVFLMDEGEVRGAMKEAGYAECEKEMEDWGECRLGFPDGSVDFYFEDGDLVSVNIGL